MFLNQDGIRSKDLAQTLSGEGGLDWALLVDLFSMYIQEEFSIYLPNLIFPVG